MSDDYKQNIKDHSTWMRGFYIVLFTIIYSITEIVIALIVAFQFLSVLLTQQTNDKLLSLSMNLSTYVFQILKYVTFNSSERPYPFADFPGCSVSTPESEPVVKKKKVVKKKAIKKTPKKDSGNSSDKGDK